MDHSHWDAINGIKVNQGAGELSRGPLFQADRLLETLSQTYLNVVQQSLHRLRASTEQIVYSAVRVVCTATAYHYFISLLTNHVSV